MNRLRRLFHRHRWTVVALNHCRYMHGPETMLLRTCEICGKPSTTTLAGHWPIELFRTPAARQGE